jgi:DNA modification methylase/intein/homing endonuclease
LVSDVKILVGDCRDTLQTLPDDSIHCVVTSPPYYALRNYNVDGQIGLEDTIEEYIETLVGVFREVWRVLHPSGTVWLNLGDSYNSNASNHNDGFTGKKQQKRAGGGRLNKQVDSLKPKDLMGIPWRVALALQADGWWLRQDIIWCLSGGTQLYVRGQKGDIPMTVRELSRLDPSTVQLWNGEKWTQVLGVSRRERDGTEIQLTLRSGERITCSSSHRFPTSRGLIEAKDLTIGDVIEQCQLPEPDSIRDCAIDEDAAWFAGVWLADGSRSEDTIQITGNANKTERWERIQEIAKKYGGYATMNITDNTQNIRVYGKMLNAILYELTSGRTAINKGFGPVVWKYSNSFLAAMLDGYLSGDGYWDEANNRWRLGFCRNYKLERDIRTACARLGYHLTLRLSHTTYSGEKVPTFHGEIRKERSGHWNEKSRTEVVDISKSGCRYVYDIGVADEPHLFALASGVLTHNSKSNPMPESVKDRCTKSHEYIFLLTKRPRYYFDYIAVREDAVSSGKSAFRSSKRRKRSVWHMSTQSFKGAHFATFPYKLAETCILAGASQFGCCPHCLSPWGRVIESKTSKPMQNPGHTADVSVRNDGDKPGSYTGGSIATIGWQATCKCSHEESDVIRPTVMDMFGGSGTVAVAAVLNGQDAVLCELKLEYADMSADRITDECGMLAEVVIYE